MTKASRLDYAKLKDSAATRSSKINTKGECFDSFIRETAQLIGQLEANQLRENAISIVRMCVETYSTRLRANDVGARPSREPLKRISSIPEKVTGLLYGKVQSGKTNASIATVALAKENGFRCFIVLTSDNKWLLDQTAKRFKDSLHDDGPIVRSWPQWKENPETFGRENIARHLSDRAVVLISTKNRRSLETLIDVLRAAETYKYPTLILDDEADNASLNTQTAAAALGQVVSPSAIFSLIGDIRREVHHHIYLQITATPQSLLLQALNNSHRPAFSIVIRPGSAYMGGELFFAQGQRHSVTEVEPDEIEHLKAGDGEIPTGLAKALLTFFLGFAQKYKGGSKRKVFSFLAHICHKKITHSHLEKTIGKFVDSFDRAIRGKDGARKRKWAMDLLQEAYIDLKRTCKLKPLKSLIKLIVKYIASAQRTIINADLSRPEPEYNVGMNILVGGNRLGRGVTIEGLLVTYYGRDAIQKQMDTVHQHARMFGYRKDLQDVTRLFIPKHIFEAFQQIHEADDATREAIGDVSRDMKIIPVWVGDGLKPTRSGVLNPADINVFSPGRQIYPYKPVFKRSDGISAETEKLEFLLRNYNDEEKYYEVPIGFLIELLSHTRSKHTKGGETWEDGRVLKALRSMAGESVNVKKGRLNVRTNKGQGLEYVNKKPDNSRGYADSRWVEKARMYPEQPTLVLMRQKGRKEENWDNCPLYIPTLVMPKSKFIVMYAGKVSGDK